MIPKLLWHCFQITTSWLSSHHAGCLCNLQLPQMSSTSDISSFLECFFQSIQPQYSLCSSGVLQKQLHEAYHGAPDSAALNAPVDGHLEYQWVCLCQGIWLPRNSEGGGIAERVAHYDRRRTPLWGNSIFSDDPQLCSQDGSEYREVAEIIAPQRLYRQRRSVRGQLYLAFKCRR